MLFTFAFISSLLLASAVLAGRHRENGQTTFLDRVEQSTNAADGVVFTNNWAGAVWDKDDGTFNSITGTFATPVGLSGPDGSGASAWVGLDGDTCKNSFFRAGVDFVVEKNVTSYKAWYQWYADKQRPFSNVRVSAGDKIRVTVVANSSTTGIATVENLTNGQSMSQPAQSILSLCSKNAEWVVEVFGESGNLASFANFTTVTFTDAKASGAHETHSPHGATILNIEQNNQPLTSVSIKKSSLTVKYV